MDVLQEDDAFWIERELNSAKVGDSRLDSRLIEVAKSLMKQPAVSILQAMGDWNHAKAAYRLLSNEKVAPEKILEPHQNETIYVRSKQKD